MKTRFSLSPGSFFFFFFFFFFFSIMAIYWLLFLFKIKSDIAKIWYMEAFDIALLRKKTLLQKCFPRSKLYPLKWWRCGELTVAYGKAVVIDVGISSSDGWKIVVSHFWNMEYYITKKKTIRLLFFCLHFFTYVISSCTFLFPDVSLSSISLLVTFFFLNVHSQDEIYSIIYFSTINWDFH